MTGIDLTPEELEILASAPPQGHNEAAAISLLREEYRAKSGLDTYVPDDDSDA